MEKTSNRYTEEVKGYKRNWLKTSVMILLIVGLGLLAVNQVLEYIYNAEFLKAPCQLCRELNPDVAVCLNEAGKIATFWNANGSWSPQP